MNKSKKIISLILIIALTVTYLIIPDNHIQTSYAADYTSRIPDGFYDKKNPLPDFDSTFTELKECIEQKDYTQSNAVLSGLKNEISDYQTKLLQEISETDEIRTQLQNNYTKYEQLLPELEQALNSSNQEKAIQAVDKIQKTVLGKDDPENIVLPKLDEKQQKCPTQRLQPRDMHQAILDIPIPRQLRTNWLEQTDETVLTDEIKDLADSLSTPLAIYNYIKNNINFESYYGSRKGAIGTFEQKGGNDIDTASLLIAMLRYKGYQCMYVTGEVNLTPQQAMLLTSTQTVEAAGDVLVNTFRPGLFILSDTDEVENVRIEQTWAEVYIDDVWVPLDASFKEYEKVGDVREYFDIPENFLDSVHETTDGKITGYSAEKAMELCNQITKPMYDQNREDELVPIITRKIKQETAQALPTSLPYEKMQVRFMYSAVPDEKCDGILIEMGTISASYKTAYLYGKKIMLEFIPTEEARQAIVSNGGVFGPEILPSTYQMIPSLVIDGQVVAQSNTTQRYGSLIEYYVTTKAGRADNRTISNYITVGGFYSVGLVLQRIASNQLEKSRQGLLALQQQFQQAVEANNNQPLTGLQVEDIMLTDSGIGEFVYNAGLNYFAQLDLNAASLAEMTDIVTNSNISVGIIGYQIQTKSYLGGSMLQGGVMFTDILQYSNSVISMSGNVDDERRYNMASNMYSSAMESNIWELYEGCESISTMSMLDKAQQQNVPIHVITPQNYNDIKDKINVSSQLKSAIQTAIQEGDAIICHDGNIEMNHWSGYGYIDLDLETYQGDYMISGGMYGGIGDEFIDLFELINLIASLGDLIGACSIMITAVDLLFAGSGVGVLIMVAGIAIGIMSMEMFGEALILGYQYYIEGDKAAGEQIMAYGLVTVAATVLTAGVGGAVGAFIGKKLTKDLLKLGVSDDLAKWFIKNLSTREVNLLKRQLSRGVSKEYMERLVAVAGRDVLKYSDGFFDEIGKLSLSSMNKATNCLKLYGDNFAEVFIRYGDDAVGIITDYGERSITSMKKGLLPADIQKIYKWGNIPADDLYLEFKTVYDQSKYFDQATGITKWPTVKDGFYNGSHAPKTVEEGFIFKRYGKPTGNFLGNATDSFEKRALPPYSKYDEVHYYRLKENFVMDYGFIEPWFDQPGMGEQFIKYKPDGSMYTINDMITNLKVLEDVTDKVLNGEIVID